MNLTARIVSIILIVLSTPVLSYSCADICGTFIDQSNENVSKMSIKKDCSFCIKIHSKKKKGTIKGHLDLLVVIFSDFRTPLKVFVNGMDVCEGYVLYDSRSDKMTISFGGWNFVKNKTKNKNLNH